MPTSLSFRKISSSFFTSIPALILTVTALVFFAVSLQSNAFAEKDVLTSKVKKWICTCPSTFNCLKETLGPDYDDYTTDNSCLKSGNKCSGNCWCKHKVTGATANRVKCVKLDLPDGADGFISSTDPIVCNDSEI
ncbi:MAG: hypothetical protein KDD53_08095 [Bdellovibrionales bacterium]|nr:hypothetical protein [Bdellovibrionales bacterium]